MTFEKRERRLNWELKVIDFAVMPGLGRPLPIDPWSPPTLGDHSTVSESFVEPIKEWLSKNVDLVRLAYAGTVLLVVKGQEQLTDCIKMSLPFVPSPETLGELTYQVNRPRDSNCVPGIRLNCLETWATGVLQFATGNTIDRELRMTGDAVLSLELSFDLNNVPQSNQTIPRAHIAGLLSELVAEASTMIGRGVKS